MTFRDKLLWPVAQALYFGAKGLDSLDWYRRNGYPRIAQLLGGVGSTHTGRSLSEAGALNCSTVWVCREIISRTIGWLPLNVYRRRPDGSREKLINHPLQKILRRRANAYTTAMQFGHYTTANVLTGGNGFARKLKRSGTGELKGLDQISPDRVDKVDIEKGELVYILTPTDAGGQQERVKQSDMFHLRGPLDREGVKGLSVVSLARNGISLALVQEEYASKYFAHGGRRPYLLKHPGRFKTETEFQNFRERWDATYANADDFHKSVITESGLEYQELGFSLEDAQFLESRQFSIPEICRWFLMKPHMAGDLSRATFSNIEHESLDFVKYTLLYWLVNWEQEVWLQLLTEKEQDAGLYVEFDVKALERGDFASRMTAYSQGLQNGIWSIDEVRKLENEDALPDGSGAAHHIQLNMQTVPGTGQPTAAELAALSKTTRQTEPQ